MPNLFIMKKFYSSLIIGFTCLLFSGNVFSQGNTCATAEPFCTAVGSPYIFTNVTDGNTGFCSSCPAAGCLSSTPRPSWFYVKSLTAGAMTYSLSQSTTIGGSPNIDVDFIAYGPYSAAQFTNACASLLTGSCSGDHSCTGNIEDCSYSIASTETMTLSPTAGGQYYLIMITNYDGVAGYITFTQTGGNGSDCAITCPDDNFVLVGTNKSTSADVPSGSTINCNQNIQLDPPNLGGFSYNPFTDQLTPCMQVYIEPFRSNLATNGSIDVYENGFDSWFACPSGCGGTIGGTTATNGVNFGWFLGQADPNYSHPSVFCRTGTIGANTATVSLRSCWDNTQILAGPQAWNSTTCFTLTAAASPTAYGTAAFSITPVAGAAGLSDTHWGRATLTPSLIPSGTYTVTYTFNNGKCGDLHGKYVFTIPPTPTITPASAASQTICAGSTVAAENFVITPAAGTYVWNNDNTTIGVAASGNTTIAAYTAPNIGSTTIGNFTITPTASGCIGTPRTFTITINPKPTVSITSNPASSVCLNSPLTFTSSGASTYTWSSSANGGLGSTSGANVGATPTATGTITYTVNATSTLGCTNTATQNITVNALPVVAITPANSGTLCSGTSITLTGSGASTYAWQAPAGGGLSGTSGSVVTITPTASPLTYTVTGTAANTCTNVAVKTITVVATPTISVSNPSATQSSTICSGNSVVLTASGAGTFTWSPATGLSSTTGSPVTASPTNTSSPTIYTVTGTSAAGCISPASSQGTFTVMVNSTPTIALTSNPASTLCINNSLTLTAGGANTYTWSSSANGGLGSTSGANVGATPTATGTITYTVNATSAAGCTNTATQNITVNAIPVVAITPANSGTLCSGTSITLTGSGASTYAWQAPAGGGLSGTSGSVVTITPTASPLTYTVTGTAANTCTNVAIRTITVMTTPTVSVSNPSATQSSTLCSGNSVVLTASGAGTFTWSPATGLSSTTGSPVTASPTNTSSPTIYTVTGTSAAGCISPASSQGTFTITVNPIPNVSISSTPASSVCLNSALTFTASGANTYTWSSSANGGLGSTSGANVGATPTATGTISYTVNATSAAGCTNTATQNITVNALPVVAITPASSGTLCSGTSITLTGSGATSYTWQSPAGGGLSGSGSVVTIAPTASPVTYTVTGTAANTCTNVAIRTITVMTTPTVSVSNPSATQSSTLCSGNSVVLTASGAGTFTWSPATGLSSTTGSPVTASPTNTSSPTIYTVTGTSAAGCISPASSQGTFTVSVNSTPTITAISSASACAGSTVPALSFTVNPTGGSVNWVNNNTSTGLTASGNGSTIAAFTASNVTSSTTGIITTTATINGCTANFNHTLTVNPLPLVSITPLSQTITCAAPTVTLTGSSNPASATPLWTGGVSSGVNSYTATASSANIYTLTATSLAGCPGSATTQVVPSAGLPTVAASITNSLNCTVTSAQVIATTSTTPVSYSWTGPGITSGATTATASVNTGGQYTVVVTNTLSLCSTTITTSVPSNTTPITPSITATGSITCSTPTLTLNGAPVSSVTYTWSGAGLISGTNTQTATINSGGVYTLSVTSISNGCVGSQTLAISTNTTAPTVSMTPTSSYTTTCANPTVALNTTVNPSTGITYSWTAPSTGALNSYTISNPVASGSGIFTVAVTNSANGCSTASASQATVQITADAGIPVVTLSANSTSITCANQTPSIAVTTTASPVSYSWSPTTGIVPGTETTANPSFNTPGTYSVVVTNTVSGCASSAAQSVVTVTLNNTPPVISSFLTTNGGTITCANPSITVTPSITPNSNLTYTWTGGPGLVSPVNQANAIFTAPGTYTLAVTNTITGCVSVTTNSASTITIYQNTVTPTVSAAAASSNSVIGCANAAVTFTTNITVSGSSLSYNWSTGANTPTINITTAGAYSFTVTDNSNGCSASTQFTVTGNTSPPQNVNAGASVNIACGSSTTALNGTSSSTNVSYSWSGPGSGSIISGSNTASPVVGGTGTYTLTVTDNITGCQSTSTVSVTQAFVTASFTADPTTGIAPLTVNFTNASVGATSYSWDFGDSQTSTQTNPVNVFTTGTYTVLLTATSGTCTATATVQVVVEDGLTLEIPNVFTPNNDGTNDLFTIKSTGVKEISLQIFNRWGEKLYEFSGAKAAWDGLNTQGIKVPDATYFYFVKAYGFDNKEIEKHGTVNLFR